MDSEAQTINFDAKVKLEEQTRKSQLAVIGFSMTLNTKPSVVKFEIGGTATVTGKDAEINKILEVDPETKVPYALQRIYQGVFMAMYLLSTLLNVPSPPPDLLFPQKIGISMEESMEMDEGTVKAQIAPKEEVEEETSSK